MPRSLSSRSALNFCFWPAETDLQYDSIAISLKKVLEADPAAFDCHRLAELTPATLQGWLEGSGHAFPEVEERARLLRQVGIALAQRYPHAGGGALAVDLVREAHQSATQLVRLITEVLPGFRDEAVYAGRQVSLYKRAQILVADLWAAYGRQTDGDSPFAFRDVARLTMFADYRVPQMLLHLGVMSYAKDLGARVEAGEEVVPGSPMEVEIRACTIQAVERLLEPLSRAAGRPVLAIETDWLLWQLGERNRASLPPFHRCRTIFY